MFRNDFFPYFIPTSLEWIQGPQFHFVVCYIKHTHTGERGRTVIGCCYGATRVSSKEEQKTLASFCSLKDFGGRGRDPFFLIVPPAHMCRAENCTTQMPEVRKTSLKSRSLTHKAARSRAAPSHKVSKSLSTHQL